MVGVGIGVDIGAVEETVIVSFNVTGLFGSKVKNSLSNCAVTPVGNLPTFGAKWRVRSAVEVRMIVNVADLPLDKTKCRSPIT